MITLLTPLLWGGVLSAPPHNKVKRGRADTTVAFFSAVGAGFKPARLARNARAHKDGRVSDPPLQYGGGRTRIRARPRAANGARGSKQYAAPPAKQGKHQTQSAPAIRNPAVMKRRDRDRLGLGCRKLRRSELLIEFCPLLYYGAVYLEPRSTQVEADE